MCWQVACAPPGNIVVRVLNNPNINLMLEVVLLNVMGSGIISAVALKNSQQVSCALTASSPTCPTGTQVADRTCRMTQRGCPWKSIMAQSGRQQTCRLSLLTSGEEPGIHSASSAS